jgi:hypothetical protein
MLRIGNWGLCDTLPVVGGANNHAKKNNYSHYYKLPTALATTAATATTAAATTAKPAAATATATTTTTEWAATATTTTGARLLWLCFIDSQRTALEFVSVESLDCSFCFVVVAHLDKPKTTGAARELVGDDIDWRNRTDLTKQRL